MTEEGAFDAQVAAVLRRFPDASVLNVPGRRLIRLSSIPMAGDWSPSPVRALLVCDGWPDQRPRLLIGDELKRNGAEPANFSRELINDEAWFSFSFSCAYSAAYPALVPVIHGWLSRFDGRSD